MNQVLNHRWKRVGQVVIRKKIGGGLEPTLEGSIDQRREGQKVAIFDAETIYQYSLKLTFDAITFKAR